jgi:argininosuccinate synthase
LDRIVVACTGDRLLTLAQTDGADSRTEVVVLILDFGDGAPLEAVRDSALASGAVRAHVLDVREEFARGYLLPALHAGVLAREPERVQLALRHAIARRKLDEIARLERARPVAPAVIPRPPDASVRRASGSAAQVAVTFERGAPTALNGIPMSLVELFDTLATIAREHGVGRDRVAAVLQAAHASLVEAVGPNDLVALGETLGRIYADLLARDGWESPSRDALDAFFAKAQERASGTVAMTLQDGNWAAVRVSAGGQRVQ